eukprot:2655925-Pyramimonas_sp.AAC.2
MKTTEGRVCKRRRLHGLSRSSNSNGTHYTMYHASSYTAAGFKASEAMSWGWERHTSHNPTACHRSGP